MRRTDGTSVQSDSGQVRMCMAVRHCRFPVLILLVALCVSSVRAFAQGLQSQEQPNTIRGTVVNAVTGAPIARALVSSTDNRFATLTDGEGRFEFTPPKDDRQNNSGFAFSGPVPQPQMWLIPGTGEALIVRKPGFLDDPDGRRLAEATPNGEITIPLIPESLIKGRVIVSEADPPAGATVQLYSRQVDEGMPRWTPAGTARANSNGEFRFAELLPGTYKLGTTEWGDNDPVTMVPGGQQYAFPPVFYPGVSDFSAGGTIQLAAGQTVEADVPLTRQAYYPVRIPVANVDVNAGMNISVSVLGHPGPGYSLGYRADTQKIEGALPNGQYLVEAFTYGQNSANGAVNLTVNGVAADGPGMTLIPSSAIPVHVNEQFTATESPGPQTWNMGGGHSFSVRGPRTYLNVSAVSADDFEQRGAPSLRPPTGQNDDSLVIESVAPGRYRLQISSGRGYVAAATRGGVDLLHEPLVVTLGSSVPIEVTVRDDYAEIDGTVTGLQPPSEMPAGVPPPEIWIYCVPLPDSPGQWQQFNMLPDGQFNSAMMVPGTYRVLAFKKQQLHLPYRDADAMKAYEALGPIVHLAGGQKVNVQVQVIASND